MAESLSEVIVRQKRIFDRIIAHVILSIGREAIDQARAAGWKPVDYDAKRLANFTLRFKGEGRVLTAINSGLIDAVYYCQMAYNLVVPLQFSYYDEALTWALGQIKQLETLSKSHDCVITEIQRQFDGDILGGEA